MACLPAAPRLMSSKVTIHCIFRDSSIQLMPIRYPILPVVSYVSRAHIAWRPFRVDKSTRSWLFFWQSLRKKTRNVAGSFPMQAATINNSRKRQRRDDIPDAAAQAIVGCCCCCHGHSASTLRIATKIYLTATARGRRAATLRCSHASRLQQQRLQNNLPVYCVSG